MCTACTNPMCSRIFGSSTCGTKSSCKKQKTSDVNLRAASVVFMLPCVRGFNWRWLWSVVSGQSCKLTIKFGNKCSLCLLPTKMSCLVFALFRWWTLFFFCHLMYFGFWSYDYCYTSTLKAIKRIYCYDEGKISQAESFSHVSTDAESRSDLLSMNKKLWKDLNISACVRICISFSRSLELLLKPSVYGHVFGRRTSSVVSPNSTFISFKYSDSQLHPPLFKKKLFFLQSSLCSKCSK